MQPSLFPSPPQNPSPPYLLHEQTGAEYAVRQQSLPIATLPGFIFSHPSTTPVQQQMVMPSAEQQSNDLQQPLLPLKDELNLQLHPQSESPQLPNPTLGFNPNMRPVVNTSAQQLPHTSNPHWHYLQPSFDPLSTALGTIDNDVHSLYGLDTNSTYGQISNFLMGDTSMDPDATSHVPTQHNAVPPAAALLADECPSPKLGLSPSISALDSFGARPPSSWNRGQPQPSAYQADLFGSNLSVQSNHIQPALNPHLTRVMAANQAFSFVPMTASSLLQEPIQTSNQLMNNYAMQFHSSNPSSMTINPPYTSNTPAAAAALRPSSQRSHTEVNTSGVLSMMNADSSRSQSMAPLPQGMVSSASHMQLQLPDDHQLNDQQSLEPLPQRPESPVTTTQRNLEELELEDVNGVVLKCPQCDKEFSKPYSLKSHMVVHSGVKPHACDECGHSFARRHDLLRHYRTLHNSSRPFKCQHCSMSFVKEDILQRHMESRHVVKQYVASSHAPSTEATDPSSPDSNRPDGHALIHAGGPGRLASDDTVGTKKRKTSVARRRSRNMQAPLVHSIDSGNTCEQVIEAIEVSASPSSSNLNIECGVVYNSTLLPQLPAGSMLKAEGGYSASSQANASQVSAELQSLQAHQHRVIQQMQYQKQQQQFQIPMSGSLPPYPVASPQHQQFQQMQHIQQQLRQQQMQQHTYPMQFQLTNGLSAHSLADGQAHPHHNLPLNSHQQAQNLYQQPRPHSQSMQLPIQSHSQPFDFSPNSLTPNTFTGMNPTPSSIAPLASSHIHASRIDPTPSPVSLDITGIYDDFSMWQ